MMMKQWILHRVLQWVAMNQHQEHLICSIAYKLVSSVVPDFSRPLVSYRGEDTGEMFVRKLQEEAEQMFQEYIDTPQQLIELTDAELRSFHTAINCHICNQPLEGDKVRDHCHIVGSYRGTAHSRCNLAYIISKSEWKLPVVIHNLKGYNGHLIVKALKSEVGEVREIPQSTENYLFITVDRLKFIDSLKFTPQSRDSLVKTLEVDEFKYVREEVSIQHEFELINRKGSIPMTTWIASPDLINLDYLRRMHSSACCLTVRVRTRSMHTQLKCGLPLNVSQWQTTTIST